jgi:hypothetical protein
VGQRTGKQAFAGKIAPSYPPVSDKSDGMTTAKIRMPTTAVLPGMDCPACNASVPSSANYCLNCGKRLRTIPPATSVLKQTVVYLVSFFLAPLGLWYAWKYLKQEDNKSRAIGVVAIVLTVISVAITVWTTARLFNSASQLLKSLSGLGL